MCKKPNKGKGIMRKIVAFVMAFEGLSHIIVALLSLWGIHDTTLVDWKVYIGPISDLFFGLTSLYTSYFIGHEDENKDQDENGA